MTLAQQVVDFLVAQGPAILVLVYSYMNGKVIRANNNAQIVKLQSDIAAAHAKIDALIAGKSDPDAINALLGSATTQ